MTIPDNVFEELLRARATKRIKELERQVARLEDWSTMLFAKLYDIECGECTKNMVACKCDEEER